MNELEHFETGALHLERAESFWQRQQNSTDDRFRYEAELRAEPGPDRNHRAVIAEALHNVYADLAECRVHFENELNLALVHYNAAKALAASRLADQVGRGWDQ